MSNIYYYTKYKVCQQFCVYMTVYSGQLLPAFYIGSTNLDNLINGYHGTITSVNYKELYQSELLNSSHLFNTFILSSHKTREEAFDKELELQKEHVVVESKMFMNMAYANCSGFIVNDVSIAKMIETKKNDIDEYGVDTFKRASIKAAETMKNTFDKNGLNIIQRKTLKMLETKKNDIDESGNNAFTRNNLSGANTMRMDIDETGINALQRRSIKGANTKMRDIDEFGLNGHQRGGILIRKKYVGKTQNSLDCPIVCKGRQALTSHFKISLNVAKSIISKSKKNKDYFHKKLKLRIDIK